MVTPSPSTQLASLRPDIKMAMQEFNLQMNISRMIGLKVFPVLEVEEQGGSFPKLKLEAMLKVVDTARASGGAYKFAEYDFTDDTYATKENGITVPIDRRNKNIYSKFGADLAAGNFARNIVMTNHEMRVAAKVFDPVTFTPTSVTNEWSDFENATPITDVENAVQRSYAKGVLANALIVSWKVFRNLRHVAQVIDRITADGAGQSAKPDDITAQMLATVFSLDYVLVGAAQYNAAKEGQSASLQPIWSNEYAAVARVAPPGGSFEDPCIGRTFHWGGDGSSISGTIETWYDEEIRGDRLRYRMETQEKLMYVQACELLDNITE